jgi:hypothetical protein
MFTLYASIGFLLAADSPTGDPLAWLTQAGAVGVLAYFCFAFMTGRLRTEKEVLRLIGERDRALELVYKNAELAQAALRAAEVAESKVAKE